MSLRTFFFILLGLFLPTLIAMAVIDTGLKVPSSPAGIVSFEFCGLHGSCEAALAEWGPRGRALAMLSLGLDYLFMTLYPALICTGLLLCAARLPATRAALARRLAWLALGAGIMDALENYSLIRVVLSGSVQGFGPWAGIFASLKFLILCITLGGLLYFLAREPTGRDSAGAGIKRRHKTQA